MCLFLYLTLGFNCIVCLKVVSHPYFFRNDIINSKIYNFMLIENSIIICKIIKKFKYFF